MARDLSARWRRVAGPYTIFRVLGQGLEFLAFVLFARALNPAAFGLLSVGYVIARYGALIADWGVSVRGPRDVVRGTEGEITALVRHRERVALGLTVLYAAGCFAFREPDLAPLAALVLAGGMTRDWVALGREAGVRSAAPSVARGALILAGAVLVGSVIGASWALAAGAIGGGLVSIGLNRVGSSVRGSARLNDPWILIATVMAQIYISLDILLLALLRDDTQAGIYSAVYRIPNAWITINGLLVAALLPVATRQLKVDPTQLAGFVRRDWRIGAAFGAGIVVLSPLGALLVTPLFGDAYRDGQVPLILLCVATGISTITSLLGTTYLVVGSDRTFATALAAGAGINILVNLAAIPLWGMTGAAIATIISELLVLAVIATMLQRVVHGGVARA